MKDRKLWIILAFCALALIALALLIPDRGEPSYGGISLTDWVARYNNNTPVIDLANKYVNEKEADGIRAIGTNAIPWLLKWIQWDEPKWPTKLRNATKGRLSLNWFYRGRKLRADYSMTAVRALGTNADVAIPELARLAGRSGQEASAARAIFSLAYTARPTAIPPLVTLLKSRDVKVRQWAIIALAHAGPVARSEWPAVLECLKDTDQFVAATAAGILGDWKSSPEIVVPVLIDALTKPRFNVNAVVQVVTIAIANYGPEAKSAVPVLRKLLESPDDKIRQDATDILLNIQPEVLTNVLAP
jgi:hypothetical protein